MAGGNFEDQFGLVLDRLHEIPYGEATWQSALVAVADFLGAEGVDMSWTDSTARVCTRHEPARIDMAAVQKYSREYLTADFASIQPRGRIAMDMRENQVIADSDVWSRAERNRMVFFGDFYDPLVKCDEGMLGCARSGANGGPHLLLATHYARGAPLAEARRRQRMLLPHLRRVCMLEIKLEKVRSENAVLADALDRIPEAVALLDSSAKVLKANHAAIDLLRRGAEVSRSVDGRLMLPTSDNRAALARCLAQSVTPLLLLNDDQGKPPERIVIRRTQGSPMILTLYALPKELSDASGACAIAFIVDPDAKAASVASVAQNAFDLTDSEAALCEALLAGTRLAEDAAARGVSVNTVKSQLQAVFSKTGTNRQADLVRLLRGMAK